MAAVGAFDASAGAQAAADVFAQVLRKHSEQQDGIPIPVEVRSLHHSELVRPLLPREVIAMAARLPEETVFLPPL